MTAVQDSPTKTLYMRTAPSAPAAGNPFGPGVEGNPFAAAQSSPTNGAQPPVITSSNPFGPGSNISPFATATGVSTGFRSPSASPTVSPTKGRRASCETVPLDVLDYL